MRIKTINYFNTNAILQTQKYVTWPDKLNCIGNDRGTNNHQPNFWLQLKKTSQLTMPCNKPYLPPIYGLNS